MRTTRSRANWSVLRCAADQPATEPHTADIINGQRRRSLGYQ